jgi:hypothetical protein
MRFLSDTAVSRHDGATVARELVREFLPVGTLTIALAESWPSNQAGRAIEAASDFKWRGGTLMISRRMRPSRTACSLAASTLMCQLGRKAPRRRQLQAESARTLEGPVYPAARG